MCNNLHPIHNCDAMQQPRNHTKHRLIAKIHFVFLLVLVFLCELLFLKPRFLLRVPSNPSSSVRSSHPTQRWTSTPTVTHERTTLSSAIANVSDAPLFYHISPGSTGSRSLYHAACHAGFPSVHHKSFCISSSRGIADVANEVVAGVRAHYQILRLYSLAGECCKLWNKGELKKTTHDDEDDEMSSLVTLCMTPLDEWAFQLQHHLTIVLQSGLVGLFDTPYPYLAPEILDLTKQWRASTIIAMTKRDPTSWAKSRSKHGLLLCREEYSYKGLGSSEFDVLGCITRAYQSNHLTSWAHNQLKPLNAATLRFWNVFRYRSHHEDVDPEFRVGLERQMEHHQTTYLPLAGYTPDFFGVESDKATTEKQKNYAHNHVDEKDISRDIRRHVFSPNASSSTRHNYDVPLKCRGRVNWELQNDTFLELYHLPKTCDVVDDTKIMIPLM